MNTDSFEEKLKNLEEMLAQLESGTLSLSELVNNHSQANEILSSLTEELKNAEQIIESLQQGNNEGENKD